MHTTNYAKTLILPSPDCAATAAIVPSKPGTVAALQYEWMKGAPNTLTSDDLIFGIHAHRNGIAEDARLYARAEFFSKGQACLRSSPLVKTYGWGIYADAESRVMLVDPAGELFENLCARDDVAKLAGMRSKRA